MCNLKFANSGPQDLKNPRIGGLVENSATEIFVSPDLGSQKGQQREQLLPVQERLGFLQGRY